jgi:hypothetical protein
MRYYFCLVLLSAFFSYSCKQDVTGPHPEWYELRQNWPNPFKDTTYISYGVPSVGNNIGPHVRVVVVDRFKNIEVILVDQINHSASIDTVIWIGRNSKYEKVPAGIYYIELQTVDADNVMVRNRIAALKQ